MIYEKIKEMRMFAMKAKDESLKSVLTVLLGEVDRIKDTKGTADDIIVSVVQKMAKNAEETIKICKDKGVDCSETVYLISVLDNFRPKSLTETAIRAGVKKGIEYEITGYIAAMKHKYPELLVFLTGGDDFSFDTKLKSVIFADRFLVLKGLNRILNYNNGRI